MCQIQFTIQSTTNSGTIVSAEGRYKLSTEAVFSAPFLISDVNNAMTPDILVDGDYDLEIRVLSSTGNYSDWTSVGGFKIGNCSCSNISTLQLQNTVDFISIVENQSFIKIIISQDGTKLFIDGSATKTYSVSLSTPYDISSAGATDGVISLPSPQFLVNILDNGTRLYMADLLSDTIYEYILPTPYDITILSPVVSSSFVFGSTYSPPSESVIISNDGKYMYIFDSTEIHKFTFGTNFVLSTLSFTESIPYIAPLTTGGFGGTSGQYLTEDGTVLYVHHWGDGKIYQFNLATPYDIATWSDSGNEIVDVSVKSGLAGVKSAGKLYTYREDSVTTSAEIREYGFDCGEDSSSPYYIGYGSCNTTPTSWTAVWTPSGNVDSAYVPVVGDVFYTDSSFTTLYDGSEIKNLFSSTEPPMTTLMFPIYLISSVGVILSEVACPTQLIAKIFINETCADGGVSLRPDIVIILNENVQNGDTIYNQSSPTPYDGGNNTFFYQSQGAVFSKTITISNFGIVSNVTTCL